MATADPTYPVLSYRVAQVEKNVTKKADQADVEQIAKDVRGLRKVLIALMSTIAGSAVVFALSILELLASKH